MNKADVKRDLGRVYQVDDEDQDEGCHLVSHGVLGLFPVTGVVNQRHQEERAPEDEVGGGDHNEHLHPGDPLCLKVSDIALDLHALGRRDLQQVLTVLQQVFIFSVERKKVPE